MRTRKEEITIRVTPEEKRVILRKARKCGIPVSVYLRLLGTGKDIRAKPPGALREAYEKVSALYDDCTEDPALKKVADRIAEIGELLLDIWLGETAVYNKDNGTAENEEVMNNGCD